MTEFNMLTLSAVLDVVAGRFVEEGEEEEEEVLRTVDGTFVIPKRFWYTLAKFNRPGSLPGLPIINIPIGSPSGYLSVGELNPTGKSKLGYPAYGANRVSAKYNLSSGDCGKNANVGIL